jgi:predicted phosphoribosyltransferase
MYQPSEEHLGFVNRREAGAMLGLRLRQFLGRQDLAVLALPRDGVPVGREVAHVLHAPFDVFVVRELRLLEDPGFTLGAIAGGGVRVLNDDVLAWARPHADLIDAVTREEEKALTLFERVYRGNRPAIDIAGRIAILVDQGAGTGSTMRAAALAVSCLKPARIVVALPVASSTACAMLRDAADDVVCLFTPEPFSTVRRWYLECPPTTDEDVRRLLVGEAAINMVA